MLDERTKQAISFMDSIYSYAIDATKVDCALHILDFLNENKKYTPHSRVLISKQLIYNVLDAEVGITREKEQAGELKNGTSIFDSEGEGKPRADIVEKTWQRICEKYPAKGIYSTILDERFTFEIIETGVDILIERFDKPASEEEPKSKKEPVLPEDPVKAFEREEENKNLFARFDLEDEAENLFRMNRDEEAIAKVEEAINLTDNPYIIFDIHFRISMLMAELHKHEEAILWLHRGISYSNSFLVSGEPILDRGENYLMDLLIVRDDGKTNSSYSIFQQIKQAIELLELIPEEEATMLEMKRIYRTISSMVLQLEEWQSKILVE